MQSVPPLVVSVYVFGVCIYYFKALCDVDKVFYMDKNFPASCFSLRVTSNATVHFTHIVGNEIGFLGWHIVKLRWCLSRLV